MGELTVHTGTWTLEDRFASPWQYLPVEVAPGTAALRVELEYDRTGSVLDLGCLGPSGFRGWSGGARESFVIAAEAATPGYLPGEIEPGLWQVMIGLHMVAPDGARYRVTAEPSAGAATGLTVAHTVPVPADRPARRDLPAAAGRRWLAGDLHAHTVHSDGAMTVPELACFAISRGLDFIAVTDHNTVSHHAGLPSAARRYGITLLPGQPAASGRRGQVPPGGPVPGHRHRGRDRETGGRPGGRLGRDAVAHAVRRHQVQADHHLPQARLDLAGQVSGRRGLGRDHERLPGAT